MLVAWYACEMWVYLRECTECTTINVQFATDYAKCSISSNETTTYEECYLHNVCPCYRSQTSIDRIQTCDEEQDEDDCHTNCIHLHTAEIHIHICWQTQNLLDSKSTEPCYWCQVDEDIQEQPEDRETQTYAFVVAVAQELWNGKHFLLNHQRQQELTYDNQCCSSHQLVCGHCDTAVEGRAWHTDKLLSRNVCSNQRSTDSPPCQGVTCKEVVGRRLFLALLAAAQEDTEADEDDNVSNKYEVINGCESIVTQGLKDFVHFFFLILCF